jgi:hypothetical protein
LEKEEESAHFTVGEGSKNVTTFWWWQPVGGGFLAVGGGGGFCGGFGGGGSFGRGSVPIAIVDGYPTEEELTPMILRFIFREFICIYFVN